MRDVIEEAVQRLFADKLDARAIAAAEATWPAELWRAVEEAGITRATGPESDGGGVSWTDVFVIISAIGQHAVPLPLSETLFAHWLLATAGMEAPDGPMTFATDVLSVSADGRVSGSLRNVPWGRNAANVVAVAHALGGRGSLVRLATENSVARLGSNVAREPRDTLRFERVRPSAMELLPAPIDEATLRLGGAMLRAAQVAGGLQRVLNECVQYAQVRRQFGRSIGSFQVIQHQIALLAQHAAATRCIAETAFANTRDRPPVLQVASAKIVAADAVSVGTALAHGIHGAIGLASEHFLQLVTRRLWAWRSEYGSREVWARHLGRLACEGGESQFWPAITSGAFGACDVRR
jgi:acyl-CoA dehydrogenase